MSLRTFLILLSGALVAVAFVAAGAVIRLTSLLDQTAADLRETVQVVDAVEGARDELLLLDSMVARMGDGPTLSGTLDAQERTIRADLEAARALTLDPNGRALLDQAQASLAEYLSIERRTAAAPPEARARLSRDAFERSRRALRAFARSRQQHAEGLQQRASRLDHLGDIWGYGAAAVALVGAPLIIALAWTWIITPLLQLREGTKRYATGDAARPVAERGPREMKATVRTFNEMVATLEHQRSAQLAFLGGVVHDLRNPLSALRAGLATLPPDRPLPAEERIRKTLAMVDRQITRLDRMAGDLLETSRAMAGKLALKLEPHDVRTLAEEAVALFRPVSGAHELRLEVGAEPLMARCDALRMEQVLGNLLSNAIKYSPAGGSIATSVHAVGDEIVLRVADQGMGIAAEELPHIFDPFRRVARSDGIPGTGLGLAVVKRIVEAHGGRITVESAPARGSTFAVHLPRLPAMQLAAPESRAAPATLH